MTKIGKLVSTLFGSATISIFGFVGLASAADEWSDIQYIQGKYSRFYMDFVVEGGTGTFYALNDWGTNQNDGGVSGGVKPTEYNIFTFSMSGDDYEIRIFPDGTHAILKNGFASTLPGFVSACSWTTSPNLPTTDHAIWEFSFEVPSMTTTSYAWIGKDPTGPTAVISTSPPAPPTGMDTGPSAFTHYVDGSFSDSVATPTLPPDPTRAVQTPERDPHFSIYDNDTGWTVGFTPGGGVHVKANFVRVPTLSEWGMIFMMLALLTIGIIVWRYRARPGIDGGVRP